MFILTNNPMVKAKYIDSTELLLEGEYLDVLKKGRDYIHKGYILLTHPLYGSVKPYETMYRSLVFNVGTGLDYDSLGLIEEALLTAQKFKKDMVNRNWNEQTIKDFRVIDLDLISGAIERI